MTLGKYHFKKILLSALLVAGLYSFVLTPQSASALSGSDFQAARIIDDGVFFNPNSMSLAQIQEFLNAKVPSCDTNGTKPYGGTTRAQYSATRGHYPPFTCLRDYRTDTVNKPAESGICNGHTAGNKSAAQIIYEVSQSCGVSPKALLVLLQKEQSLVTDDWPWSTQYRSATGYGCPDTAPCDAEYYGYFNQVYMAARQFKRYAAFPDNYNYKPNRNNFIQYNPNSNCSGTNVFIKNQSTAGLYNYTPYQPNHAALGNLYGTGDECSAYGNRNFWRMYNDWFGQTLLSPVNLKDTPTSISTDEGKRLDVFAREKDGALWQRWYDESGGWRPWTWLENKPGSSLSVSSRGKDKFNLFLVGSSGDLQHLWYDNGWKPWESLGKPSSSVSLVGTPTAISWSPDRIDIFAKGSDGALWQRWYDESGGWRPWTWLENKPGSSPSVSERGIGKLNIFSVGSSGDLQHLWYDNGWKPWESLDKPVRYVP